MPSLLPRINVTVSVRQHELLRELGALTGRSSASYLREMLDAGTPMLEALLPIYRQAAETVAQQPQALQEAIRDALGAIEANRDQLDLLEHLVRVQPALANDQGEPGGAAAPSGAREDGADRSPRARKRS